jgi:hypothetical protein
VAGGRETRRSPKSRDLSEIRDEILRGIKAERLEET